MTHRELMKMPLRGTQTVGRFEVLRCTVDSWCVHIPGGRAQFGASWRIAEIVAYVLAHDELPPE